MGKRTSFTHRKRRKGKPQRKVMSKRLKKRFAALIENKRRADLNKKPRLYQLEERAFERISNDDLGKENVKPLFLNSVGLERAGGVAALGQQMAALHLDHPEIPDANLNVQVDQAAEQDIPDEDDDLDVEVVEIVHVPVPECSEPRVSPGIGEYIDLGSDGGSEGETTDLSNMNLEHLIVEEEVSSDEEANAGVQ